MQFTLLDAFAFTIIGLVMDMEASCPLKHMTFSPGYEGHVYSQNPESPSATEDSAWRPSARPAMRMASMTTSMMRSSQRVNSYSRCRLGWLDPARSCAAVPPFSAASPSASSWQVQLRSPLGLESVPVSWIWAVGHRILELRSQNVIMVTQKASLSLTTVSTARDARAHKLAPDPPDNVQAPGHASLCPSSSLPAGGCLGLYGRQGF